MCMDLSLCGQSRDAEGRRPAAHPGLGPWVGARVASPRCPILRPGGLSVSHVASVKQRLSPWPWPAAACRPSPVRASLRPRQPPRPAEFRAGVMSANTRARTERTSRPMLWRQSDRRGCCRAEPVLSSAPAVCRTSKDIITYDYSPAGRRCRGIVAREPSCTAARERFALE
jgi:hypothetical protein